ncbi:hypothetical protein OQJ26_00125 [Legionella sp. PATHC038]|uniref:hypothetical protein n=1 Tax=Legionella sheltonii TaxID=2992041 RepID=UPI0022434609|nr:hypothetical protein [Legionella sp. PATHC038]MCW8397199.1 hypothetical protein [Legionella sp. PATHC038]
MSNGKTEPTSPKPGSQTPGQTVSDTPPPPKPQVIAPDVSDGPKQTAKKDEDKPKQEQEVPKAKKAEGQGKEEGKDKKDPMKEYLDDLGHMVEEIQGDINGALKNAAGKAWDKAAQSKLGKALGGLSDAIGAKKDELIDKAKQAVSDKVDEKLAEFNKTPVGQAVGKFTDALSTAKSTITSLPDKANDSIVQALEKLTEKVNNIGKKEELGSVVEAENVEADEKVTVQNEREDEIEQNEDLEDEQQEEQQDVDKENEQMVDEFEEEEENDTVMELGSPSDTTTSPMSFAEQSLPQDFTSVSPQSSTPAPSKDLTEDQTATVSNTM